ncbi:polyisoprenoid-binding protein [Taibaiella sp. KBW10]|uniref:YceI family protein n=1 Tax=Taibaiella sp. KBW10 TaxID=2153357 RepID=UPI000F5B28EE|nr:YceI family protein [Taibaiella sp. KBW10]RQO31057.1 polyisoprenoid-binding protein [Taibaiella sp. KBW10]
MKKTLQLLSVALLMFGSTFAQVKWSADPAHTNARFSIEHLGISFVDGEFTKVSGGVDAKNDKDFNGAAIAFDIDVNSINTRIEARDGHLKSPDFFNAAKYGTMSLKSVSFTKVKGNQYKLVADLTIKDVTKRVTFNVVQNGGIITDPWGKTRAGFTAKTSINRMDFNLSYNDKLPSGVPAVGNTVEIVINTELVKG